MTSARPLSDPANPPGATPVGGRKRGAGRKKGLLLAAALLALLVLAVLLLSQCGTEDPRAGSDGSADAGSSVSSSPDGGSAGSSAPGGSAAGAAGGSGQIVTAGGESVLDVTARPDAAAALGALSGETATATAVQVLSVPADEGFWVGTSDSQRVWVQLTGEVGESPYQVTEGDTVDFEGAVVAHDEAFAAEVGVDDAEGAAQLTAQAAHIEVAKSAVVLSS